MDIGANNYIHLSAASVFLVSKLQLTFLLTTVNHRTCT